MLALWLALIVSTLGASGQLAHTKDEGARFEWGWQLQTPPGQDPATTGQYYVRLPQAEQQVRYRADQSGYHGAVSINTSDDHHRHATTFALGHQALALLRNEEAPPGHEHYSPNPNYSLPQSINYLQSVNEGQPQVEIFLLQQQFSSPLNDQQNFAQILPNPVQTPRIQYDLRPNYLKHESPLTIQPKYIVHNLQQNPSNQNDLNTQAQSVPITTNEGRQTKEIESSTPLSNKEVFFEQNKDTSVQALIQVFKDHNCSQDDAKNVSDIVSYLQESKNGNVEEPKYDQSNINGDFGSKLTDRLLSYRGAVHFRVEAPDDRHNARSERVLFSYDSTTAASIRADHEKDGISKLVASTQDLITNEDLLSINHAAEKYNNKDNNEDIIKPHSKFNPNPEQTIRYNYIQPPRSRITVRTKLGNVIGSEIEHLGNNAAKEPILYTSENQNKFSLPIVVPELNNFKDQVVNNIVSTVAPYLEEGYAVTNIRNTVDNSKLYTFQMPLYSNEEYIDVTPRPSGLGQTYLAPITVALRLLNANDTDLFNDLDDHEGSDSEVVSEIISPNHIVSPVKEKTVVEVHKSIEKETTHINDVEHHQYYLEDGRSNNDNELRDMAQSLFNKYVQTLESSRNIQENKNENLYRYGTTTDNESNNSNNNDFKNSNQNLESSENIQTEIEVHPDTNSDNSNERKEYIGIFPNKYRSRLNNQIIQPIVIEKEVPVTKFVDRFVEKQVPYPEPVEVVREVKKPVVIPVPVNKYIDRPVEVTRYVDKPYAVQVPQPYPVEIKVPYPIEKKVYVDRPVQVPYPVERIVEKQVIQHVPVPTPVAVPVENKVLLPYPVGTPIPVPYEVEKHTETIVEKPVPVPYPVERKVPYPVPYETKVPFPVAVEKRVPVPVPIEKVVEKPVTVTKYVEKPIHVRVPYPQPIAVPQYYPQPYPVERIVEKKVPYPVPVDRIVEKRVPYEVKVPVEKLVHKIVEKPVVVTKYVDKPYPVETKVPYPVEKIVEKRIPYAVQVPYEIKVPYPVEKIVEKPVHVPYKVPYPVETFIAVPFYGQSQQVNNYQKYTPEQHRQGIPPPHLNQKQSANLPYYKSQDKTPIFTTQWGNHYAASYQYINNTRDFVQKTPQLSKYIDYLTNAQHHQYYGPTPPPQQNTDWYQNARSLLLDSKLRRTDRTPRMNHLRIEYGFKPPLVPSTEVDLDGRPVNNDEHLK